MAERLNGRFAKKSVIERRQICANLMVNYNNQVICNEMGDGPSIRNTSDVEQPWQKGERRIFEPFEIADQLQNGCEDCGKVLLFTNVVSETRSGLGSLLYTLCGCGYMNKIYSGKVHYDRTKQRRRPIYDINSKAAIAMFDNGMGTHKVNRFLADMNIPGISPSALSERAKEVGRSIRKVTEDSLDRSLEQEKTASLSKCEIESTDNGIPITLKYDMCWQKRGSGRKYDSKSGVGTIMGNETGKIVGREIRSSDCRTCSYYENKHLEIPSHQCSRNWYGTSKGMEPDVGASVMSKLEQKNCIVKTVIMDDDATTLSRIRQELQHEVEKWSDINHVKKTLGNKLYSLQNKDYLPKEAIMHIMKCFTYAIHANKNQTENMRNALSAVIPHVYGSHDICQPGWCGYCRNPEEYIPTIIMKKNESLRKKLEEAIANYVLNINKISPCASTKEVESFNNMLTQKAPKNRHYCASESLELRVDCTVSQKNESFNYVSLVNTECGLSPGKHTTASSDKLSRKRQYHVDYCSNIEYKKRKATKKLETSKLSKAYGIREGDTYKTGIDMTETNHQDTDNVSPPAPIVTFSPIEGTEQFAHVFFDIETTSLSMNCDIVQISALCNDVDFNQYIIPSTGINKYASEVTGLSMYNNFLCYHGHKVNAVTPQEGLYNFFHWLTEKINGKVVLIGHNSRCFDAPRLVKSMIKQNICSAFEEKVIGFVDTLPLFRTLYPDYKKHSQEFLADNILKKSYAAHNAAADVQILRELTESAKVTQTDFISHSFTFRQTIDYISQLGRTNVNLMSLEPLVEKKVLSKVMAKKIAESGLNLAQLKVAKRRDPIEGVHLVFSEKALNNRPRVTSCKKVSAKVSEFLNV